MFTKDLTFKDISNFNNINDYLPILNGIVITDMIVILLMIFGYIQSNTLKMWYELYGLSAVIADVLIIFIGFIITRYLYPKVWGQEYSLIKFIALAVFIQAIHDMLFYMFFTNVPLKANRMLDTFKLYAKENGVKALLADSAMMVTASILSSYLASQDIHFNIITLVITMYVVQFLIYN
jgi:hypothetical protein